MTKVERVIRNTIALAFVAAGLSGDAGPSSRPADRYVWGATGINSRGCTTVWVLQSHEVAAEEEVFLDIQPVTGGVPVEKGVRVDLSNKPTSLFFKRICAPGTTGIIFTATREDTRADPSIYLPNP